MSIQSIPALFLVSLLACSNPAGVLAAESSPPPKPTANAETASRDKPPLIIHNADGTMTVQKEPESGNSKGGKQKGLVIPPQVVVPTARTPANEPPDQAH